MNWKTWLKGLAAAVISAAANSVVLTVVDPMTFNATPEGLLRIKSVATVSAILGAALYLKQSPLPNGTK